MIEKFDETNTTASTLGNANWSGEVSDIKEALRKVQEQMAKNVGRDAGKIPDRIVVTPEAFKEIDSHLFRPGMSDKPAETINGIPFEVVANDTTGVIRAIALADAGETVILFTKGETGLCVRNYSKPSGPENSWCGSNPPYRRQEVSYNGGLGSCLVPIPYSPFTARDEPIRFNPKWDR